MYHYIFLIGVTFPLSLFIIVCTTENVLKGINIRGTISRHLKMRLNALYLVNVLKLNTNIISEQEITQGVITMARPKKEVVKEKTLQSRVSLEEYAYFCEYAESCGMNISTLIRVALINYCKNK